MGVWRRFAIDPGSPTKGGRAETGSEKGGGGKKRSFLRITFFAAGETIPGREGKKKKRARNEPI